MVHIRTNHYSGIVIFFIAVMLVAAPNYSRGQVPATMLEKVLKPSIEKSVKDVVGGRVIRRSVMESATRCCNNIVSTQKTNSYRFQPDIIKNIQVTGVGPTVSADIPIWLRSQNKILNEQKEKTNKLLSAFKESNENRVIRFNFYNMIVQAMNGADSIDQQNGNDSIFSPCIYKILMRKDITKEQRDIMDKIQSCYSLRNGDSIDIVYAKMRELAESAKNIFPDNDPDINHLIRILSCPPINPVRVSKPNTLDSDVAPKQRTDYHLNWKQ